MEVWVVPPFKVGSWLKKKFWRTSGKVGLRQNETQHMSLTHIPSPLTNYSSSFSSPMTWHTKLRTSGGLPNHLRWSSSWLWTGDEWNSIQNVVVLWVNLSQYVFEKLSARPHTKLFLLLLNYTRLTELIWNIPGDYRHLPGQTTLKKVARQPLSVIRQDCTFLHKENIEKKSSADPFISSTLFQHLSTCLHLRNTSGTVPCNTSTNKAQKCHEEEENSTCQLLPVTHSDLHWAEPRPPEAVAVCQTSIRGSLKGFYFLAFWSLHYIFRSEWLRCMDVIIWILLLHLDVTKNYADFCTVPNLLTEPDLPVHNLYYMFLIHRRRCFSTHWNMRDDDLCSAHLLLIGGASLLSFCLGEEGNAM